MDTPDSWVLIPERMEDALGRWHTTDDPDYATRERVDEWLQDTLRTDPLRAGTEDPEHPGVFDARVPRTNVGVTYVPEPETRRIGIASIDTRT